ncbi:MAG: DinB family protein [Candidatus Limnocylindria bacterium]
MDQLDRERVAAFLEASCALIEAELGALGADASWHAAAGEWCANEVVGHLIESERRGFNGRIRHFLREDHPATTAWDQIAVARERRDCERLTDSLWMELMGVRHDSIALVRSLTDADCDRSGRHPKVGELRVRDLLHEWVHHDRNHTKQLLAIGQQRVWPHMGNAQRFSGE